jgi:SAM-dependent methyltransferase
VDAKWWQLFDLLVAEADLRGRRVLDVGCGTGRFAAALDERASAKVWAVDPSPEMLDVARRNAPPDVGFRAGSAEGLPFKDGWFERVTMRLVVHLVDRPQALAEARRVLGDGGRLAIATFDPAHFDHFWLNRLFPSLERIDRARFPTPDVLDAELRAAGFADVRVVPLSQAASLDRRNALEKIRGRHISTFDLLDEDEYRAGLAQAERGLPERVDYRLEWAVFVAIL